MNNCLICGNDNGLNVVYTFSHFDERLNSNFSKWTYGYNDNSWLTEEEAVFKAEALIHCEKSIKDIRVKQLLGDGSWITINLKTSPFAYHNKKTPLDY